MNFEAHLAALARGLAPGADALVELQVQRVLERRERGVGRLRDRMAPLFEAWTGTDADLVRSFLASPEGGSWSDFGGPLVEEALADWATRTGLVSEATARRCVVQTGARLLALGKRGPACFVHTAHGWVATDADGLTIVQGTRILRG
ncbi:MAG: hypothetical protein KTR31_41150 [Myxococcales bacterium]|nr:hypothetical protein [Myxococcales bacterium]